MAQTPIRADAGSFAVEHAHRQLKNLALQVSRAAKSCTAAAVHDVRVSIRRFTQAIAVCQSHFRGADLPKNRRRLKKIMTAAGEVRNCDIALKLTARFRVPHAAHLRAKLESRRKESSQVLITDLKKWTARRVPSQWHAVLDSAQAAREESLDEFARRVLGRIAKDFQKQGNEASSHQASPKCMHRFRIAAKKFRYALELFQPAYPSLDVPLANIKQASALLGDVNDCVTVAEMVADYKGGARLADRLKKRQHKKTEQFRYYWKEQFNDAERLQSSLANLGKKPAASSTNSASTRKSVA